MLKVIPGKLMYCNINISGHAVLRKYQRKPKTGRHFWYFGGIFLDVAFLLTVGSFLLTVELFAHS